MRIENSPWGIASEPSHVVHPVKMGIANAAEIKSSAVALNHFAFVEQHPIPIASNPGTIQIVS